MNMISHSIQRLLPCGALLVSTVAHATIPADATFSFAALERRVTADIGVTGAASLVAAAVPAGLPIAEATGRLERAGASCRPDRVDPVSVTCSYDDPVVSDSDSAASVHWTTMLLADRQRVRSISVTREIERH